MNMKFKKLDEWRKFFQNTKASLLEIKDNAIIVAAKDHPEEFKNKRGLIAEKVYSCQWAQSCSESHSELDIIEKARNEKSNDECENGGDRSKLNANAGDSEAGCIKDSNVDRSRDDHSEFNHVSYCSDSEAEALYAAIGEQSDYTGEVLSIKQILHNNQDESEKVLLDCLTRLQLMHVSVVVLKATEIGKVVNVLRRHKSKSVNSFARQLIKDWKLVVDDYLDATEDIAVHSTDSDPSTVDEESLPFPTLEEVALFTHSMELSEIFDGIDDDGNLENSTEIDKNHENERTPLSENPNNSKQQSQFTKEENMLIKGDKCQQINQQAKMKLLPDAIQETVGARKKNLPDGNQQVGNAKKCKSAQFKDFQEPVTKTAKPTSTNHSNLKYVHGRQDLMQKTNNNTGSSQKCKDGITKHKRQLTEQQTKLTSLDDAAVQAKLEVTRRKLQEKYQEIEKAKKERMTQFMDLHELPKQVLGPRNKYFKGKYHNQHWANGKCKF